MSDLVDRSRTPLLALITAEAVDRDYQAAASRRAAAANAAGTSGDSDPASGPAGPDRQHRGLRRVAVVAVAATFAALVSVAAAQTSQNADVDTASRADLVARINARRDRVADLQQRIADLRVSNTAAERYVRTLGEQFASLRGRQAAVGALSGFEPVTGAGVRITLDDPALAGEDDVLRDSDLNLLANALWEAGAEAVTINGQRLTGVGAVRNAGDAIEVNGVGVAPPYTVLAIGDPRTLAADVVDTESGLQFLALTRRFGFRYELRNADDISMAAAPASLRTLEHAEAVRNPKVPGGGAQ